MKPILYKANETNFSSNGLGQFSEATYANVREVANGEFTLEINYPQNGFLYPYIKDSMLIKAKPNDIDTDHVFRIYDWDISSFDSSVTIFASSITDDLANDSVENLKINSSTPQEAMLHFTPYLQGANKRFTLESDITTRKSTTWLNRNVLNCVAGEEGSLLDIWGGEVKRTSRSLSLLKRRGRELSVVVRQGKNLQGFVVKHSTKGMVTKIRPYRMIPENEEVTDSPMIPQYGTVVESPHNGSYALEYLEQVDYSQDESVTDLATLNSRAASYFTENSGKDTPSLSVEVDLLELSGSEEYEKFKHFETIGLFDRITFYSEEYGLNIQARVNLIEYDSLSEMNVKVEVGSVQTGFAESVQGGYKEAIKNAIDYSENEIKTIIQTSANGKNKTFTGTLNPNASEVNGEEGDLYYRIFGEEKELWIFKNGKWDLIVSTADIAKIEKEIEKIIAENALREKEFRDRMDLTDKEIAAFEDKLLGLDFELDNIVIGSISPEVVMQAIKNAGFSQSVEDIRNKVNSTSDSLETTIGLVGNNGVLRYNKNRTTLTELFIPFGIEEKTISHNGDGFEVGESYTVSFSAHLIQRGNSRVIFNFEVVA